MNEFSKKYTRRRNHNARKSLFFTLSVCGLATACFALNGCSKQTDYFSYVSELRSNILLASDGALTLRAYASEKESPYAADGICRKTSPRAEIYLSAPTGAGEYTLSFTVDGKTYGGEMSFDNIKTEYYFSCTLDISDADEISFTVAFSDISAELTAKSVRTETMLTPKAALSKAVAAESDLFSSMTDKNGFAGEIYLRLLYEDAPYYYVGIIDREGKTFALLVDSADGKILARRKG